MNKWNSSRTTNHNDLFNIIFTKISIFKDAMTREHLQTLMARIWKAHHITFIIVTHSIEEATFLGTDVLILSNQPATIRAVRHNARAGTDAYRSSEAFFHLSSEIREILFSQNRNDTP